MKVSIPYKRIKKKFSKKDYYLEHECRSNSKDTPGYAARGENPRGLLYWYQFTWVLIFAGTFRVRQGPKLAFESIYFRQWRHSEILRVLTFASGTENALSRISFADAKKFHKITKTCTLKVLSIADPPDLEDFSTVSRTSGNLSQSAVCEARETW